MIGTRKIDNYELDYPIELRLIKNNEFDFKLQYRLSQKGLSKFDKIKRFLNNMHNWEDVIVPIVRPGCENKSPIDKFYPSDHIKGYVFSIIKYDINDIVTNNINVKDTYKVLGDLPEFQSDINEFVNYYRKCDYERMPTIKKL